MENPIRLKKVITITDDDEFGGIHPDYELTEKEKKELFKEDVPLWENDWSKTWAPDEFSRHIRSDKVILKNKAN